MKLTFLSFCISIFSTSSFAQMHKAPAYPLITHDSYFSIWSMNDTLNAAPTKHWTGADQPMLGMVKVDGKVYRVLGKEGKTFESILPASDDKAYSARYSENDPQPGWQNITFNDASWKSGKAPFSDNKIEGGTLWKTKNLWIRRTFNLSKTDFNKIFLKLNHDDNIEVYLNGKKVYEKTGWIHKFEFIPLDKNDLKNGKNVLAIHIANTAGGAFLDAGIVKEPALKNDKNIIEAEQKEVTINATQTIYDFACGPIDATLTFTSPLLLKDLELLSRPVSYITYSVKSNDEKEHNVQLYFGASTDIAVNVPSQEVVTKKYSELNLSILKAGTKEQPVLQKKGNDLRIDWGYMYVATPSSEKATQYVSTASQATSSFVIKKKIAQPPLVKVFS